MAATYRLLASLNMAEYDIYGITGSVYFRNVSLSKTTFILTHL